MVARLDARLKVATTRGNQNKTLNTTPFTNKSNRHSLDVDKLSLSQLVPKKKPATLEPLPFEIDSKDVKYSGKRHSELRVPGGPKSEVAYRFKDGAS